MVKQQKLKNNKGKNIANVKQFKNLKTSQTFMVNL